MQGLFFCTACRSRTGDLLRERQLSWTTRRMRQGASSRFCECKGTTFFETVIVLMYFFLLSVDLWLIVRQMFAIRTVPTLFCNNRRHLA